MDTLFQKLIHETPLNTWLTERQLDWLASAPVIDLINILVSTVVVYYIGRFFIAWGVRCFIHSAAKQRSWHKKDVEKREKTLIQMFSSFWKVVVIAYLVAIVASKVFKIDLSPLFASAGIIGIALGFGAQSLVKDFLAGIFIISENQYRVGDVVDIMGSVGTVERVGTRSTVIRDIEGNVHYIPNGTIQLVINKTMDYSVSRFVINVDPNSDIAEVIDIINQTGKELAVDEKWKKKIIEAPKFVYVDSITGYSIDLTISGKTMPSDQWSVTSEMRRRLLKAFDKKEISLATLPAIPLNNKNN